MDLSEKSKILEKLYALQRFGIKPGLERTEELLASCSNPHKSFKSIHIAGTNGKGSVCSMLASVLQEAGYKVGLYTSPHIVNLNERIKINGIEINDDELIRLTKILMPHSERIGCTFFEITTALAFLYFAEQKVDVAVIETGMGGRFDSTNVLNPLISVITNIALDHQEYLGNTIQEIAFEKAGIIKADTPVIIGEKKSITEKVFKKKATELNSEIIFAEDSVHGKILKYQPDFSMEVNIKSNKFDLVNIRIDLAGSHQLKNIITSISAIENLQNHFKINENNIINGLNNVKRNTKFIGRIELINQNPPFIIDVAHNPDSIKNLVKTIERCGFKGIYWDIVFAAMKDKDIEKMLMLLKPICNTIIITEPNIERAAKAEKIADIANNQGFTKIIIEKKVEKAIKKVIKTDNPSIVVGSFYLLGEALPVLKNYF